MAWFEGTFDYTEEKLKCEFPFSVSKNLRMSEDKKRLAIINDFVEGSELLDLSDPQADEEIPGEHVFYHVFLDEYAAIAKEAIEFFMSECDEENGESISLFRREADRLFMYSYGHICSSLIEDQINLRLLINETPVSGKDVFILPLKRYMYKCPVCGHRTLQYRGYFEICLECGWEDEGMDDEDVESCGANEDYTIKQYREKYLKLKEEDPSYSWWGWIEERKKNN